jgi:hypothetical protein
MIDPSDIMNAVLLVVVNVCGYVALGKRLERVELKLDQKVDVEEHDEVIKEIHVRLAMKANRL